MRIFPYAGRCRGCRKEWNDPIFRLSGPTLSARFAELHLFGLCIGVAW